MFNIVSIKIPARFFIDINKIILKFLWMGKGTRIPKIILRKKKKKVEAISLPVFKTSITFYVVYYIQRISSLELMRYINIDQ